MAIGGPDALTPGYVATPVLRAWRSPEVMSAWPQACCCSCLGSGIFSSVPCPEYGPSFCTSGLGGVRGAIFEVSDTQEARRQLWV